MRRASVFSTRPAKSLPSAAFARPLCVTSASEPRRISPPSITILAKERLYTAVLQYAFGSALERYPPLLDLDGGASAELRLRAFIRSFMLRCLGEGSPAWLGKLMAREMAEPTRALDILIQEAFRPLFALLMSIVAELLGPQAEAARVRLCADSILGQCLHYRHAQPVFVRFDPGVTFDVAQIERWADHIAEFSLAALRQFARSSTGGESCTSSH